MRHLRDTRSRRRGHRFLLSLLLAGSVLACVLAAPGCDSSTAPEADEYPLWFLPRGSTATVPLGGHLDFQIDGPGSAAATVTWTSERHGTATGARFRYRGDALAADVLRAVAEVGGTVRSHTWTVGIAPGDLDVIVFTPASASPPVFVGLPETFAVTSDWGAPAVTWSLDGEDAGEGPEFVFAAAATGRMEMVASVVLGDTVANRTWTLDVRPAAEARPGEVVDLVALPGTSRGEIRLTWAPPATTVYPLAYYEMRLSTSGPVTEENWDGLPSLPIVPHTADRTAYAVAIPSHLTGLDGGETVWCSVRARNARNLLSAATNVETTAIDGRWWATGTVRDHLGTVLADVEVTTQAPGPVTLTAADGSYRLGPFEMTEAPVVAAALLPDASWHTALSHPRGPGATAWDFLVLPRYGCDPRCTSFDGHFVAFLRSLTGTLHPTTDRPNTDLYKWETWPVPVHVPEFTSPGGIDYAAACRAMVQAWNDNLGGEYMVLVPEAPATGMAFAFDLDETGLHGRAELDEPGGGSLTLGEAVPERVTLRLQPGLPNALAVQAVALHEMGHALGLYSHAVCNEPGYLMWLGGINPFERPPAESIHVDEIRAVQLIRELPQGLEMAAYPTYDP